MRASSSIGGWVVVACAAFAHAAEPVLTHLDPPAVERGHESAVTLIGKFDPWPCQFWSSSPGIEITAGADAGRATVKVAADVATGPHLVRAFNAEGVSAPVALVVAGTPQVMEVEPNDDYRAPQEVALPSTTLNGRHEKSGDVDCFGVTLARGQVLIARIEAYVLAAGMDSMLRVVDMNGLTLAFNHDHATLDPFLAFTAPYDGRFVVQTMGHAYPASSDIRFAGGPTCIYRLHLTTGPVVRNTWPVGVTRGDGHRVKLEGWNLSECHRTIEPGTEPSELPVIFSDGAEFAEGAHADPLPVPSAVSGRIEAPGQEDGYRFEGTKDTVMEISVAGRSLGSAIDPWVKVRDAEGKELVVNDDDRGTVDSRLVWTVPADGSYTAVVGDVTRRGGEDFFYRLSLSPAMPSAAATVKTHAVKVQAGASTEVKVSVVLVHGWKAKLTVEALSLPAGVTAMAAEVPEAGGEVTLVVHADASAPASGGPVRLVLRESDGGREHPVVFALATVGEDNGVPQGYQKLLVPSTDHLWLTVVSAPAPAPDAPS